MKPELLAKKGDKGEQGISIVSTAFDENGNTVITYSNGATQTISHNWKNCYTLVQANCSTIGKVLYACEDCGLVRMVTTPLDSNSHIDTNNDEICDRCFCILNKYAATNTTITFYHTMGENLRNVLDKYIKQFNKIYPNITIQHQQVGGYDDVRDKIKTELLTNQGPNMAYCYPDHVALYNTANCVVDLYEYMNSNLVIPAGSLYGNTENISIGMT